MMSERITRDEIRKLQALPFPHCPDITKDKIAGDYFSMFLPYQECCLSCGMRLGGLLGTFTWSLAHGSGFCGNCHYPARAYHYVTPEGINGERAEVILLVHPDKLYLPGEAEAASA